MFSRERWEKRVGVARNEACGSSGQGRLRRNEKRWKINKIRNEIGCHDGVVKGIWALVKMSKKFPAGGKGVVEKKGKPCLGSQCPIIN